MHWKVEDDRKLLLASGPLRPRLMHWKAEDDRKLLLAIIENTLVLGERTRDAQNAPYYLNDAQWQPLAKEQGRGKQI